MGFDPRQWRPPPFGRPVTANLETLLADNQALQAENRALRRELQILQRQLEQRQQSRHSRVSTGAAATVTSERVEQWIEAMASHPRWSELRLGPPGGLRGLIDDLRRHWWNPALSLEQELERRSPGLAAELAQALRGPHSRGRWAVRAAFALYGPRAPEWLNEDPARVVTELHQRLQRLERRGTQEPRRRGTRTANHSQAGADPAGQRRRTAPPPDPPPDPIRQALALLGLEEGASPQAIKRAYRRLAKTHHPDLGGDPQAFHRLEAAYRLLLA